MLVILISMIGLSSVRAGQPTISNINPTSGDIAGGTSVTITGTHYDATATVMFGGTTATGIVVSGTTSITCITPARAAGAVDVVVSVGARSATSTGGFTYTGGSSGGGGTGAAGTFRFLTSSTSLPGTTTTGAAASTNLVYDATLLTANAGGPVTFAIASGRLPTGLTLDAATGFITGRPTVVESVDVTFSANDGTSTITLAASIKVSAKGGGGNAGIGFPIPFTLASGRVGAAYVATITVEFGVGPFFFGAVDLPTGLTLSGLEDKDRSVKLSGTPTSAGTFYVTFSCTDEGEGNNKVLVVVPLTVLPAASDFKFTTQVMDNGEVNAPFSQLILTSVATGVTIGASGLPPGLSMNAATGEISGTPTTPGTFVLSVSAFNGTDTITMNRSIVIVPNGSQFFWVFSGGLPTGTLLVEYGRTNPPLVLATANPGPGSGVMYSAVGLPEGITYSVDGVLSGLPTEPGLYPVTFSAVTSTQTITLAYDMVVLPPNGGDVNSLPVNLWVKKLFVKLGTDGKESWQAQYIFNSNRTKDKLFDPKKNKTPFDALILKLGGIPELNLTPGTKDVLSGNKPKYFYKSATGVSPARSVKLDLSAMTLAVGGKNETITDTLPSIMTNKLTLGSKGYKLDLQVDSKGKFTPTAGYRKTAFVVAAAKLTAKAAAKDSLAFSMLLGDPNFGLTSSGTISTAGTSTPVIFKITSTATKASLQKVFTGLVTTTLKAGVYKMKSGKDSGTPSGKFAYDSKSGKLSVALKGATLTSLLASAEDHLTVEMAIGEKQYFTGVTVFAPKSGIYSTKMP